MLLRNSQRDLLSYSIKLWRPFLRSFKTLPVFLLSSAFYCFRGYAEVASFVLLLTFYGFLPFAPVLVPSAEACFSTRRCRRRRIVIRRDGGNAGEKQDPALGLFAYEVAGYLWSGFVLAFSAVSFFTRKSVFDICKSAIQSVQCRFRVLFVFLIKCCDTFDQDI